MLSKLKLYDSNKTFRPFRYLEPMNIETAISHENSYQRVHSSLLFLSQHAIKILLSKSTIRSIHYGTHRNKINSRQARYFLALNQHQKVHWLNNKICSCWQKQDVRNWPLTFPCWYSSTKHMCVSVGSALQILCDLKLKRIEIWQS